MPIERPMCQACPRWSVYMQAIRPDSPCLCGEADDNDPMDTHNDPQSDPFKPPAVPIEVHCLHCNRDYESYLIHWVEEQYAGGKRGFWCCPTPGCDGKGFGFDIFPTDLEYRDEEGNLMWHEDEAVEEGEDIEGDNGSKGDNEGGIPY